VAERGLRLLCGLLLGLFSLNAGAAEVYRCEVQGRIEFRQTPCPADARQSKRDIEGPRPLGWVVVKGPPESAPRPPEAPARGRGNRHKDAAEARRERRCFGKRQALERLEWQMRHGYKAGQSASLHQRQRAYEAWLSRYCRE